MCPGRRSSDDEGSIALPAASSTRLLSSYHPNQLAAFESLSHCCHPAPCGARYPTPTVAHYFSFIVISALRRHRPAKNQSISDSRLRSTLLRRIALLLRSRGPTARGIPTSFVASVYWV